MSAAEAVPSASDRRAAVVEGTVRSAAAGAGAGLVAGVATGMLARLVMRLLAATSPHARGMTTDDLATVGVISASGTLALLVLTALPGAAGGLVYAGVRHALPGTATQRALTFGAVGALLMGSSIVKDAESVDFGVLQPAWFAVVAFTLLPGFGAWLAAALVERWHAYGEARPRWLDGVVVVVGGLGLLACFPVSLPLVVAATVVAQVPALARAWSGALGQLLVRVVLALLALDGLAADVVSIVTRT